MTDNQKTALDQLLKTKGYKKYPNSRLINEDYYFCKGFSYTGEGDDRRPQYQIFVQIWDWSKYKQHDGERFGMQYTCKFHLNVPGRWDLTSSTEKGLDWFENEAFEMFEAMKEKEAK